MRMHDLISVKKHGRVLSNEGIACMMRGFVSGEIPDYQMSAMLMAIYFQGMNEKETTYLTLEMAHSDDMADLLAIEGIKVDKHSTGGVGGKTTLVTGPLMTSLGVKVAKMSDHGLGHTGGTIDKMESIPGPRTSIPKEEFFEIMSRTRITVIGQSGSIVPADKKLYALRDVTATVDSIPLTASSIISEKLAIGSDGIVLDVKTGSGAFMKTLGDSIALARRMVAIGAGAGRSCCKLVADMDVPLGHVTDNTMGVTEAVDTLRGEGPEDLTEVYLRLAAHMLYMADCSEIEACYETAKKTLGDGSGSQTLAAVVKAQGGDEAYIPDIGRFGKARFCHEVKAERSGYITRIDTEACGIASVTLGAGRSRKEDVVDYSAGIYLEKRHGDAVEVGQVLAVLYASNESLFAEVKKKLLDAYEIGGKPAAPKKLIYARVTKDAVVRF